MKYPQSHQPLCFRSFTQWLDWLHAARVANPGPNGYCLDCTPEYKKQMVAEKRCEFPLVAFRMLDGELVGWRKLKDRKAAA